MKRTAIQRWATGGVLTLLLVLFVGMADVAHASHYYLPDLDRFSTEQVVLFRNSGVQTTEHFLKVALTPEGRRKLAPKVKLSEAQLQTFALECELLQIVGVGPKMVRLFNMAGVTGVKDLSVRDANNLLQRLILVNSGDKVMEELPPEGLLYNWIQQAKDAKYVVVIKT